MKKWCGLTDPSVIHPFSPFLLTETDATLGYSYWILSIKCYYMGTVCQKLLILFLKAVYLL